MMDWLLRIEESGFSQWVRESDSLFAYPGVLLVHTIGMGLVVGINATLDLRILGFAPAVRLQALKAFLPVLWIGFWINALTGLMLVAIHPTKLAVNPYFYVKLAFIALAVINLRMLTTRIFGDPATGAAPSRQTKTLGLTSLLFWIGAVGMGRMLAYFR